MIDFAMAEQRVESASFQRESLEGWAEMFGLMADRTRLRILFHLSRNDELHVTSEKSVVVPLRIP